MTVSYIGAYELKVAITITLTAQGSHQTHQRADMFRKYLGEFCGWCFLPLVHGCILTRVTTLGARPKMGNSLGISRSKGLNIGCRYRMLCPGK